MIGPSDSLRRSAARMQGKACTNVTVVSGPPLSGKTTYVQQHRAPHDLVVDWDALAVALGSPVTHGHDDRLRPFIASARDAVYDRVRRGLDGHVWIISTDAAHADAWPGAEHVQLTVTVDEAHARATTDGRPDGYHTVIDGWFGRAVERPATSRQW